MRIYKGYGSEYPYKARNMVQYLHFGILKCPFIPQNKKIIVFHDKPFILGYPDTLEPPQIFSHETSHPSPIGHSLYMCQWQNLKGLV